MRKKKKARAASDYPQFSFSLSLFTSVDFSFKESKESPYTYLDKKKIKETFANHFFWDWSIFFVEVSSTQEWNICDEEWSLEKK